LFAGRFAPEKGVDVLIRAAARSGVAVHLAGEGRLREDLEDLAVAEGADVTFLGWCDRETLAAALRTAAALVVPSIWPEVFALVICEAFGAGVPVIGTNLGGTADLLGDNRGFVYEPHDVDALATLLRRVIGDPSEADTRAKRARDFATREMTRQRWSERFAEAYESLGRPL
jgi:glycosyltransferase involved in cell wall biosynthesis